MTLESVMKWATRGAALIPGVMALTTGIGAPPDCRGVFFAVLEVVGAAVLIVVRANASRLRAVKVARLTRAAVLTLIAGMACMVTSMALMRWCVVAIEGRSPVYFPVVACPELSQGIAKYGSRSALVEALGSGGAEGWIMRCGDGNMVATTVLLLVVYAAGVAGIALGMSMVAVRLRVQEAK